MGRVEGFNWIWVFKGFFGCCGDVGSFGVARDGGVGFRGEAVEWGEVVVLGMCFGMGVIEFVEGSDVE